MTRKPQPSRSARSSPYVLGSQDASIEGSPKRAGDYLRTQFASRGMPRVRVHDLDGLLTGRHYDHSGEPHPRSKERL